MARQRKSHADLRVRADQRGLLAGAVFARREQLGLRQEELAELADCSARFVHDLEGGKTTVQLDKVLAVLDALGLGLALTDGGDRVGGLVPSSVSRRLLGTLDADE
jgi:y4mF family transcriptional regulator